MAVGEEGLAWTASGQGRIGVQEAQQGLALVSLGAGQGEGDWQAAEGGDQVPA